MPAVCDGVGEVVGKHAGFVVDLAASVEEGRRVEAFDGGEKTHSRCFGSNDKEEYLVDLLEEGDRRRLHSELIDSLPMRYS